MRRFSLILSTTAFAAIVAASPAFAQAESVPPADPAAQAPADPAQAADAQATSQSEAGTPSSSGTDIVVTGLRRSLQSARNIKRNSTQVIDAVVAEEIGKLPDITVSDTAARIPGVQVERNGGEASRVLLRGLDNT
jgi:outer membrane cobalamin receptor